MLAYRGSAVIVNAGGTVVARWGDHMQPVYPRSAVKPLQAIPLLETGAAEAFGLGDSEIALACASHGGEKQHTEAVRRWLGTIATISIQPQLPRSVSFWGVRGYCGLTHWPARLWP